MGNAGPSYVLLDRDGVINEDRPESVLSRDQFVIFPQAPKAIAELNRKGYRVLVITNQACVGRGDLDPVELEQIHKMMREIVSQHGGMIEAIYVCPHTDEDGCDCRKPRPGLVEQARRDFDFDPAITWMAGDALRDVEAARSAGCKPALLRTGKDRSISAPPGVPVFDDLLHFSRELPENG